MVETLIQSDEWVLDTPYLRRWRTQIEDAQKEVKEVQHQLAEKVHQIEESERQVEEARHQAKLSEQAREQAEQKAAQQWQVYLEHVLEIEKEKAQMTRRQDIMNIVAVRYNPPLQKALKLQEYLMNIGDDKKFSSIFAATASTEDYDKFYTVVAELASNQTATQPL